MEFRGCFSFLGRLFTTGGAEAETTVTITDSKTATDKGRRNRLGRSVSLRGNFVTKHITPLTETYEINTAKPLGKGTFGVVVVGKHRETNRLFAIKIVSKDHGHLARIEREVKLMSDIDHANIVRLFGIYDSPKEVSFVMDLCTGGHLGDMLMYNRQGYLDEGKGKILVKQLLSAVAHIHSRGICHRDIKLQNILMEHRDYDTAQIKLTDFGFGIRFTGILPLHTRCGTPYTTAPEVYRECYDERCDVWSAGVVAYILLSGHRPFVAVDLPGDLHNAGRAAMITSILMGRYHFDHPAFRLVSLEGINFIRTMLSPDYRTRCTAAEALKSSWLSDTPMTECRVGPMDTALSLAVSNLRRRVNVNTLETTGMVAVAFGRSQQEATTLRSLFQTFDVENAGYLTLESFRSAMHSYSPDLSAAEVDQLFKAIDVDNDNTVSFTEFLAATIDPRTVNMEDLAKAFRLIDADNKGYITVEDICRVLAVPDRYTQRLRLQRSEEKEGDDDASPSISNPPSNKGAVHHSEDMSKSGMVDMEDSRIGGTDIEEMDFKQILEKATVMIEAADQNNDGKISYSEFIVAMTGTTDSTLIKNLADINEINEDSISSNPADMSQSHASSGHKSSNNQHVSRIEDYISNLALQSNHSSAHSRHNNNNASNLSSASNSTSDSVPVSVVSNTSRVLVAPPPSPKGSSPKIPMPRALSAGQQPGVLQRRLSMSAMLEGRRNAVEASSTGARNTIADVLRRRGSLRIAPEQPSSGKYEVPSAASEAPVVIKAERPKQVPGQFKRWLSEAAILDNRDEDYSFNDISDDDLCSKVVGGSHERLISQNKFSAIDEAIKQIMK